MKSMETKHQFVEVGGSAEDQSRLENNQQSTSNLLKNNVTEPDADFACFEKYGNGIGSKLLKKHGWREGMGLGKLSTGRALPLTLTECDARKHRQKQGIGYKIEQVTNYPKKRPKIDGMQKRTKVKSWIQNRYQHIISDYDAPSYNFLCSPNNISAPPPYSYSFPPHQFANYFPDYPPPQFVDHGNPSPFCYLPSNGQAQLSFQWESQFFGYPVPTPYPQVRSHLPDQFCQNAPPALDSTVMDSFEKVENWLSSVQDVEEIEQQPVQQPTTYTVFRDLTYDALLDRVKYLLYKYGQEVKYSKVSRQLRLTPCLKEQFGKDIRAHLQGIKGLKFKVDKQNGHLEMWYNNLGIDLGKKKCDNFYCAQCYPH